MRFQLLTAGVIAFFIPTFSYSSSEQLVGTIQKLFRQALTIDEYYHSHVYQGADGNRTILSLEPYPTSLVSKIYQAGSLSPSNALRLYNDHDLIEGMRDIYKDGSAPLRLQQYASRHNKSKFPFMINLTIQHWYDLESLEFLHDLASSSWQHKNLFNLCLFSLSITDCCLQSFDTHHVKHFPHLSSLDLHNNMIKKLISHVEEDHLPSLEHLDLSDNSIKQIGTFFRNNGRWLRILSLEDNEISSLPDQCFSGLSRIDYLNLANNLLRSHKISTASFEKVGADSIFFNLKINLDNNVLIHFPSMKAVRQKLIELSLNDNPISDIAVEAEETQFLSLRAVHLQYPMRSTAKEKELAELLKPVLPD
ncbi:leucine-rich repeat domain-containing protein, partial [Candidatus Dependentiae bacterium]|nr:leucine-rich repeat domain-containing protein [Candidatus Dependentiae bacterium]